MFLHITVCSTICESNFLNFVHVAGKGDKTPAAERKKTRLSTGSMANSPLKILENENADLRVQLEMMRQEVLKVKKERDCFAVLYSGALGQLKDCQHELEMAKVELDRGNDDQDYISSDKFEGFISKSKVKALNSNL